MAKSRTSAKRLSQPPHHNLSAGIPTDKAADDPLPPFPVDKGEQLAYLADMIDELGSIAHRLGSTTLAGLLELAKREALLERSRS